MARLPRLTLAHHVHHVIHRGNNRQPVFLGDEDYARMHALLVESASTFGVAVHAYVLMPTHFHLLATPEADEALPQMMQAIGRRYVRWFNGRHGRSGTLWEGRYRSTVIEPESHLLDCMVHIERQPERDQLTTRAADWAWSSNAHHLGVRQDRLVKSHPVFWALGNTPFAREAAYADRVIAGLDGKTSDAVSSSALHGWALGRADFVSKLEIRTGRRATKTQAGRPSAVKASS